MFGLRTQELLLILLVLLLLFGGTKLPQLGKSIGEAIRNFKKGFGEDGAPVAGAGSGSEDAAKKRQNTIAGDTTPATKATTDADRVKQG